MTSNAHPETRIRRAAAGASPRPEADASVGPRRGQRAALIRYGQIRQCSAWTSVWTVQRRQASGGNRHGVALDLLLTIWRQEGH